MSRDADLRNASDPEKLRAVADYLDITDEHLGNDEVQQDLRRIASDLESQTGMFERIDDLAKRQVSNEPSGGESKRGWVYAYDIFAVLNGEEIR